jgi:hypothetical protein
MLGVPLWVPAPEIEPASLQMAVDAPGAMPLSSTAQRAQAKCAAGF